MTQSRDGNNKHVMFLKLRPELKNIYIYIFSSSGYPKLYHS